MFKEKNMILLLLIAWGAFFVYGFALLSHLITGQFLFENGLLSIGYLLFSMIIFIPGLFYIGIGREFLFRILTGSVLSITFIYVPVHLTLLHNYHSFFNSIFSFLGLDRSWGIILVMILITFFLKFLLDLLEKLILLKVLPIGLMKTRYN